MYDCISQEPLALPPIFSNVYVSLCCREAKQRQTMRSIINGDITLVLKSLIELGGWCSPLQDSGALFGLIATSHLTYLLSKAGAGVGLKGGIGSSAAALNELMGLGVEQHTGRIFFEYPNECSGVEELFLELSQRFNQLDYPLEVGMDAMHWLPCLFGFSSHLRNHLRKYTSPIAITHRFPVIA